MTPQSYEDVLESEGRILKTTVGTSMEPMLHMAREISVIESVSRELAPYDVILYKRASGVYVLHRIIRKTKGGYILRGDNCIDNELVKTYQIIGILRGFYRGEEYIDCDTNEEYKQYVRRMLRSYPIRYIKTVLIRAKSKILKSRR